MLIATYTGHGLGERGSLNTPPDLVHTNLCLVDDASLGPEGVAVVHVRGGGEHGHPHAEPCRLQGRRRARDAAPDDEQVGVERCGGTAFQSAPNNPHETRRQERRERGEER